MIDSKDNRIIDNNIKEDKMAIKRSELIDPDNAGYYHLISRCVRRTFLCGKDSETNKDYGYRRLCIENRILELADYFSIEVFSYAVMHRLFLLQSRHTVHPWT
jgi:hypothetical protein